MKFAYTFTSHLFNSMLFSIYCQDKNEKMKNNTILCRIYY